MKPLLEVKNLKKHFSAGKEILKAVDDVSFVIHPGETLGLVGESGCGKSTTGKTLLRLEEPTSGTLLFKGKDLLSLNPQELKSFRKEAQIIFQDPYSSLNPRMTASDIIAEGLEIHNLAQGKEKKERVDALLHLVGLPLASGSRFPHEFSGGQRQRIGIARALSLDPQFIVCDEPISALDVSVQAQIVNLLRKLQIERSLTYLFISHDLRMVKYLSTRVAVMYLGHMIELSATDDLYAHPLHPYTQALLSAIPIPDPELERKRSRIVLTGDVPSPINPPKGCVFCTRCPKAMKICHEERPSWKEAAPGHFTACHLY
jgi:oligopeptide/dipeptide ABC transporter ATP-binding protein